MGTAGNSLIKGVAAQELIDALDGFYAYELLVMHWSMAVGNRLEGQALFLLNQELEEMADQSLGHSKKSANRIAELGGAVTAGPSRLLEVSALESYTLPTSTAEVEAILTYALEQLRVAIKGYGAFLEKVRDKDAITHRVVLQVLQDAVRREADIEGVLAKG